MAAARRESGGMSELQESIMEEGIERKERGIKMRITFSAYCGGSIDIDESELEGKSKEEREIYINTLVSEEAAEVASDNVEWEIDEE